MIQEEVQQILKEALPGSNVQCWSEHTKILGAVPEFDSMTIVNVLSMVEENFDMTIEDDEVSAEVFETLGSLVFFISEKVK